MQFYVSKLISTSEILVRKLIWPLEKIEEVFLEFFFIAMLCVSSPKLGAGGWGWRKDSWGLCAQRKQQFRTGGAVHAQGPTLAAAAACGFLSQPDMKTSGPLLCQAWQTWHDFNLDDFYQFGFFWTS